MNTKVSPKSIVTEGSNYAVDRQIFYDTQLNELRYRIDGRELILGTLTPEKLFSIYDSEVINVGSYDDLISALDRLQSCNLSSAVVINLLEDISSSDPYTFCSGTLMDEGSIVFMGKSLSAPITFSNTIVSSLCPLNGISLSNSILSLNSPDPSNIQEVDILSRVIDYGEGNACQVLEGYYYYLGESDEYPTIVHNNGKAIDLRIENGFQKAKYDKAAGEALYNECRRYFKLIDESLNGVGVIVRDFDENPLMEHELTDGIVSSIKLSPELLNKIRLIKLGVVSCAKSNKVLSDACDDTETYEMIDINYYYGKEISYVKSVDQREDMIFSNFTGDVTVIRTEGDNVVVRDFEGNLLSVIESTEEESNPTVILSYDLGVPVFGNTDNLRATKVFNIVHLQDIYTNVQNLTRKVEMIEESLAVMTELLGKVVSSTASIDEKLLTVIANQESNLESINQFKDTTKDLVESVNAKLDVTNESIAEVKTSLTETIQECTTALSASIADNGTRIDSSNEKLDSIIEGVATVISKEEAIISISTDTEETVQNIDATTSAMKLTQNGIASALSVVKTDVDVIKSTAISSYNTLGDIDATTARISSSVDEVEDMMKLTNESVLKVNDTVIEIKGVTDDVLAVATTTKSHASVIETKVVSIDTTTKHISTVADTIDDTTKSSLRVEEGISETANSINSTLSEVKTTTDTIESELSSVKTIVESVDTTLTAVKDLSESVDATTKSTDEAIKSVDATTASIKSTVESTVPVLTHISEKSDQSVVNTGELISITGDIRSTTSTISSDLKTDVNLTNDISDALTSVKSTVESTNASVADIKSSVDSIDATTQLSLTQLSTVNDNVVAVKSVLNSISEDTDIISGSVSDLSVDVESNNAICTSIKTGVEGISLILTDTKVIVDSIDTSASDIKSVVDEINTTASSTSAKVSDVLTKMDDFLPEEV